jgi:hypothetical protein
LEEVNVKKKLLIVLAVVLTLILVLTSVAFAAVGKKEVALAQDAGQAWLDSTVEPPEWIGARLTTPQAYYDLEGKPSAYMFTIESNGQVVGHIIVGSSAYGYPVFAAADCPPPSIPSTDEVKSTLERDLGLKVAKIGTPTRLLYLGFDNLFAVYQAGRQEVAVNLVFDSAMPAANLTAAIPSPEEYKANKKATGEAISELWENSDYMSLSLPTRGYRCLTMSYYNGCGLGNYGYECGKCGPCSGVSIGRYYRLWKGYGDLPDDNDMYDRLYDLMKADTYGGTVYKWDYGPGFVAMTKDPDGNPATNDGYNNFHYYGDSWPTHGEYENIVSYIKRGWPIALLAAHFDDELEGDPIGYPDWPPSGGHWIAIKGYKFPYSGSVQYSIICTDSYLPADWLYLDWDHMTIGLPPYTCLIWDS